MPLKISIKLSGLAESFMSEMQKEGLNESDVISQAIGLLAEVWRTKRVALVKEEYLTNKSLESYNGSIEHFFHIQTPDSMRPKPVGSVTVPNDNPGTINDQDTTFPDIPIEKI